MDEHAKKISFWFWYQSQVTWKSRGCHLSPGMCDRFFRLEAVKSSSSKRRSKKAVTSGTASTTTGPTLSISRGRIPFITPGQSCCRLPSLTCPHKFWSLYTSRQAFSFIQTKQNIFIMWKAFLLIPFNALVLRCWDVTRHRHTLKPKYTHTNLYGEEGCLYHTLVI